MWHLAELLECQHKWTVPDMLPIARDLFLVFVLQHYDGHNE